MVLKSINPATGEEIRSFPITPPREVEEIIEKCHQAFLKWQTTSFAHRARFMKKMARLLEKNSEQYAGLMALEMGKPLAQGRAEVKKCVWVCDFYAENAHQFLKPEIIESDASLSYVCFQPLGVILAVMPWNFPFWQVFRFAAPGLMAGNSAILKHASNVPETALVIENAFRKAGFPEDLFRTLLIPADQIRSVIENPVIQAVTLTGSTPAGQTVAAHAGAMLKKTVLELGGSDPYIVLSDADLEQTVNSCVLSRTINSGQSCIAAKRFVVVEPVLKKFESLFVEQMKSQRMGNPMDDDVTIGPLARYDLREDLHRQVEESLRQGARCLLGGELPGGKGAYYPPTVLTGVKKGMPAYEEELFGPVAAIIPVADTPEAIRVANDSVFGLGSALFSRDVKKAIRLAERQIQAGCCFINTFVRSDPRLPFGGIKQSGYGRELSHFGIKEFVNIKTLFIR